MSSQPHEESLLRIVLVVLAVVVLFPLLMMVFAMPMMGTMGWWWGDPRTGAGLSPLWGVGMMLLFLIALLGVGYFVSRSVVGQRLAGRDRALEELRLAYARGDLSEEEYERRRERLQRDAD